ncbi:hypothetical protein Tco_0455255 [Tanacetum coccineum]
MSLDSFHSNLTALEFDTFCKDYGIGSEFGPELPGPNDTIRDFPAGKIGVYTLFFEFANFCLPLSTFFLRVLSHFRIHISHISILGAARVSHFEISCRAHGGWREKFLWVNASMAPIAMCWYTGKEFPRDPAIDGVDGDMVLETLLNDNPTRIRSYPEEFLVLIGLSRMWYAPAACPVFYDDDEEGRPLLEQTTDIVTQPSDHIVNLGSVPMNQVPSVATIPPPTNVKKRSPVQASALESASKKGKSVGGSSSSDPMAGESVSMVDDVLSIQPSENSSPSATSKAGEFIPGITSAASKRLTVKGKKTCCLQKALVEERPVEDGSQQLISRGSSKTSASLSFASTHSDLLVFAHPEPRSEPMAHHIPRIVFDPIRLRLKHVELARGTLKRRLACRNAALEKKDTEIERLQKLLNEKPPGEMARLRLGFEGAEREVLSLRKQVEDLEVEAGKVPGLEAAYSHMEMDFSTINGKYQDLLREKEQLEFRNASLRGQVDGEAHVKAEFARMLDEQQRQFDERLFLIGKGFRYLLNKFKESDLLGSRLGACISATISDGMRQGLEAGFVHGKKGNDIDSILAYNPNAAEVYADALNALNDVPFPLLEHDEAVTSTNPASGSTSSASGVVDQFIIAPSVPYAGDAGESEDVPVRTVESEDVPVRTAPMIIEDFS